MRLMQEKILQLVYQTMEEINQKLGTDFSKDKIEIAFFTPATGVSVYEKLCERYFPKYLTQEYKQKGYFETFAAMAFIGEEKDGILIREDVDLSAFEWHHMILHEFSHIIVCREELNGEMFYDKYCVDYTDNTIAGSRGLPPARSEPRPERWGGDGALPFPRRSGDRG